MVLRFIGYIAALGSALLWLVHIAATQSWFGKSPSFAFPIVFFLAITTTILYTLLVKQSRSPSFTPAYLLSMVCKLILCTVFIVLIIYSDRPAASANAVLFMVGYLLFTALEVGFLFRSVNR